MGDVWVTSESGKNSYHNFSFALEKLSKYVQIKLSLVALLDVPATT